MIGDYSSVASMVGAAVRTCARARYGRRGADHAECAQEARKVGRPAPRAPCSSSSCSTALRSGHARACVKKSCVCESL